jgi:bacillithiol biosynthesis deacetylase BshB1
MSPTWTLSPTAPTKLFMQAETSATVDILAIAAHRDDVEQTCGGTLLVQQALGWRTGILDLTRGESGTRGTAEERAAEAEAAARILHVSHREALDLPDGNVQNTLENRLKIAAVLRRLRPRVVILPYWQGRHPDHYTTATLGYEACFAAGLAKLDIAAEHGAPHRPYKIIYASLYADVRPTFVVDITPHIETRLQSLLAYRSQYGEQPAGTGLFVPEADIRERTFATARHYGLLAGIRYAEPFVQREVSVISDLMQLPVQSI